MSTTTPATTEELLAEIDRGWRPFRDAVRGIGRGGMNATTSAGWTFHDLLAHVAAWEDLTARRFRVFRETGRIVAGTAGDPKLGIPPFEDADAFNARIVDSHRLVGPEALIDELDSAHRRLVREVSALSDEQIAANVRDTPYGPQSWVVAVTAGNSYGHYAEHAAELGIAGAKS